jgi:hypothetical protein
MNAFSVGGRCLVLLWPPQHKYGFAWLVLEIALGGAEKTPCLDLGLLCANGNDKRKDKGRSGADC